MGFYRQLVSETKADHERLFQVPFVRQALAGELTREGYLAFLESAYHHVRHTVPLLMATGAALADRHAWLLEPLATYIDEEIGHDEWILSDIAASGGDPERVRAGTAPFSVEVMVAYAYDVVTRRNPIGFFGMVHVLESASVAGADHAADRAGEVLGLPEKATRYLRSHGGLDQDHVAFFETLMDRVRDERDQLWILHCARRFARLYRQVFLDLPDPNEEDNTEWAN